jgi:hypothetical protein
MVRRKVMGSIAAIILLASSACSPAGKTNEEIQVQGKVLLNDAPLEVGMVMLTYEDGSTASGQIIPDGTFRIPSAKEGTAKASVKTSMFEKQFSSKAPKIGRPEGKFVAVPKKYESPTTAELPVEVKKGETITLQLKS